VQITIIIRGGLPEPFERPAGLRPAVGRLSQVNDRSGYLLYIRHIMRFLLPAALSAVRLC
jgi:hypothetical protein